ncbi:MAG TPA: hypothetical protein VLG09_05365 [Candidatus Saccharimonadales bacterium]|nr:hypothetical protein [Candidatus Saccharimonadales bacterium]
MVKVTVNDICGDIRRLANTPVFIQNIKRHRFNWDLTWAAMDTIEDTELAINSFADSKSKGGRGVEYLRIYGLFQAIFMQQDAVRNLAEGLSLPGLNITTDAEASEVREIRNKYFGHHKYQRKGITTYHGISRMTVGDDSITAWTYPNFSTEDINLKNAVEANEKYISKSLESVLVNMKKKKSEYVSKIKDQLSEDKQSYAFEKIFSWVYGETADRCVMTGAGLRVIRSSINELEVGLKARYEDLSGIGDLERTIKKTLYILDILDKLFKNNPNGMGGDFNSEIYVESLDNSFSELIDICIEANVEFSGNN